MKFAKTFQKVLAEETLPDEWMEKAIRYKSLKKIINKTVSELESVGVSRNDMTINYEISKLKRRIRPVLTMNVSPLSEALIVDKLDTLGYNYEIKPLKSQSQSEPESDDHESGTTELETPENSSYSTLQKFSDKLQVQLPEPTMDDRASVESSIEASAVSFLKTPISTTTAPSSASIVTAVNPFDDEPFYQITVSLHEDAKFFQMLYEEIEALNDFSDERENEITDWVEKIADIVAKVSSPEVRKNDLYTWRKIFQIYMDSQIFFSTIEQSAGVLSNATSKIRYGKFLEKIEKEKLVQHFKLKESLDGFMEFKALNESILKVSNFQALNIMAISKILKKFDKRTHFKSKELFPLLIQKSEQIDILQNSMGRDIGSIMTNRLLNIIPQVDDYLCPICCSVAYKPIRLDCGHLFCVRCLVKLQRKTEDRCPLCRQPVVMKADQRNLDLSQMAYLKMYFPKEVKKKQAENEKEIFKEQYGHVVDPDAKACIIM
ncbi:hypothetical protein FOA43_004548 [Brettanomyces nanus]|uniref:Uncharacterized protein n=1 Tax=Eeniella nana TaxID=13502 RepID=A0A875SET1_EENNA|nr:uncharacterized protein FOA43_004548 [Brettanomyces nanus]QPG77144.1 hypothetical protein FOA43_004548 [Brettanomyces nanus]